MVTLRDATAKTLSWMTKGLVVPTLPRTNRLDLVRDRSNPRYGVSEYAVLDYEFEAGTVVSKQKDPFFNFENIELIDFSKLHKEEVLHELSRLEETGGLPDKCRLMVLNRALKKDPDIESAIQKLIDQHDIIEGLGIRFSDVELKERPIYEVDHGKNTTNEGSSTRIKVLEQSGKKEDQGTEIEGVNPDLTTARINALEEKDPHAAILAEIKILKESITDENSHAKDLMLRLENIEDAVNSDQHQGNTASHNLDIQEQFNSLERYNSGIREPNEKLNLVRLAGIVSRLDTETGKLTSLSFNQKLEAQTGVNKTKTELELEKRPADASAAIRLKLEQSQGENTTQTHIELPANEAEPQASIRIKLTPPQPEQGIRVNQELAETAPSASTTTNIELEPIPEPDSKTRTQVVLGRNEALASVQISHQLAGNLGVESITTNQVLTENKTADTSLRTQQQLTESRPETSISTEIRNLISQGLSALSAATISVLISLAERAKTDVFNEASTTIDGLALKAELSANEQRVSFSLTETNGDKDTKVNLDLEDLRKQGDT